MNDPSWIVATITEHITVLFLNARALAVDCWPEHVPPGEYTLMEMAIWLDKYADVMGHTSSLPLSWIVEMAIAQSTDAVYWDLPN